MGMGMGKGKGMGKGMGMGKGTGKEMNYARGLINRILKTSPRMVGWGIFVKLLSLS
jgi:hypothetical protein